MSVKAQWQDLPRHIRDQVLKQLIAEGVQQIGAPQMALTAEPVDPATRVPASLEQQWFLQRQSLHEQKLAWGISAPPEVIERYDEQIARRALQLLQEKFPLLTTRFEMSGSDKDAVMQVRQADQTLPVSTVKAPLRAALTGVEAWVRGRFEALAEQSFDPQSGPLWRVELASRGRRGVMLLSVCSLIADGESVYALLHHFRALYRSLQRGDVTDIARISKNERDYLDYAIWQQHHAAMNGWADELSFWQQTLYSGPPAYWSDGRLGASGARLYEQIISPQRGAAIERCAISQSSTPYAVLLSVYMHLLAELDGAHDIWVTSPSATRIVDGTQQMIGPFARQVIIRHQLDTALPDTVAALHRTLATTFDHDKVPHLLVYDRLQAQYPNSPSPYRYIFNYRVIAPDTPPGEWVDVDFRAEPQQTETVREEDILMMVMQSGDVKNIHWYMRSDRFTSSRAGKVLHRYSELLDELIGSY